MQLSGDHRLLHHDALSLAPLLLGARLTVSNGVDTVAVRLSEVEAYLGPADSPAPDPGSHSYRGRTARNAVMFGPPGHLYVYFTYGMHYCANLVCSAEGTASGILFRAGEVIAGLEVARSRRPAARRDADLASGPARLASALGLDRSANGTAVTTEDAAPRNAAGAAPEGGLRVSLVLADPLPLAVVSGPRVGVAGPGGGPEYPWRFWIDGDPTVSRYRPAKPRPASPRRLAQGQ
ncbi:DNA-3-methyladenine glycosylase [Acaricomes phytoseiuli]|nr:DNA-3-methyladenine glycosylase [Acaricomes phytoseiuli]MCW1248858.1 DNA-3-methyladenine glycosylase [Acaricomes phytoseiuli]